MMRDNVYMKTRKQRNERRYTWRFNSNILLVLLFLWLYREVHFLKTDVKPAGPVGPTGPAGPVGDHGAQGLKGDAGAQGLKGDAGAQGSAGDAGAQGLKGDAGAQGLKGDAGSFDGNLHALEWVLTILGQEPPNRAAWNFTSTEWVDKMHNPPMLFLNASNTTVGKLPSSYSTALKRRLSATQTDASFNVNGKMNYYNPNKGQYVEIIIAPESLLYILDAFGFKGEDVYSEDYWKGLRNGDDPISVSRTFNFLEASAEKLFVNGNVRVEGQLDTIGQTNSYGSVDFWPGDMFSFGGARKKQAKLKHHIGIKDGKLIKDGTECVCKAR
jgi:hypothetical protein